MTDILQKLRSIIVDIGRTFTAFRFVLDENGKSGCKCRKIHSYVQQKKITLSDMGIFRVVHMPINKIIINSTFIF